MFYKTAVNIVSQCNDQPKQQNDLSNIKLTHNLLQHLKSCKLIPDTVQSICFYSQSSVLGTATEYLRLIFLIDVLHLHQPIVCIQHLNISTKN